MRLAYDSTNPADIPTNAAIVCGYIDGTWAWPSSGWARFPNSVAVMIATRPTTNAGHVLDVETGDAFPWEAPGWAQMRRAAGADPTVYVNLSNWNATRTEFQTRGLAEPHWWLAEYDGIDSLPAGTVAKQYANPTLTGVHYDLSCVADFWPGVDGNKGGFMAGLSEGQQVALYNDIGAIFRVLQISVPTNADGSLDIDHATSNVLVDLENRIQDVQKRVGTGGSPLPPTLATQLTDIQTTVKEIQGRVSKDLAP